MIFWIFFLLILIFSRVKGNTFYGEKKWQPMSWDDLNQEWKNNFINQDQNLGIGRNDIQKQHAVHEDPEVYSSG